MSIGITVCEKNACDREKIVLFYTTIKEELLSSVAIFTHAHFGAAFETRVSQAKKSESKFLFICDCPTSNRYGFRIPHIPNRFGFGLA